MTQRNLILSAATEIESLPIAASQVLQLAQDQDSDMRDIALVVEADPGLTADFLRLANSAYFAGPRRISSLQEAGVLFGLARIQQLVMASALFPIAGKELKGYDLPPANSWIDYWRRGLAQSCWAAHWVLISLPTPSRRDC